MSQANDIFPKYFGVRSAELFGQLICRLTNNLDVMYDSMAQDFVSNEFLVSHTLRELVHIVHGLQHVFQTSFISNWLSHK